MYAYDYELNTEDLRGVKTVKRVLVWEYENALKHIDDIPKTLYIIAVTTLVTIFLTFFAHGIVNNAVLLEIFVEMNFFAFLGYMARNRNLSVAIIGLVGYVVWLISLLKWLPLFMVLLSSFAFLGLVIGFIMLLIWLLFRLIRGIYYFRVFDKSKKEIIDVLNSNY